MFDNIDEIFDIIKNLVDGVEFSFKRDNNSYINTESNDLNKNNLVDE